MHKEYKTLHGVNLGGWLVLERWITPSLFKGLKAEDEYSFMAELGRLGESRIQNHRNTYIKEEDFKWIASKGLNAVRIPVGFWILEGDPPFSPGISALDFAFDQAKKYNLQVIIDLHGAPGSQNGWDHSGKIGEIGWHKDSKNIDRTLDVLEQLAKRYKDRDNLWGIEVLNEPSSEISLSTLKDFYQQGYQRIRKHCSENVAVIFHDSFRPLSWPKCFMHSRHYKNVFMDIHRYQCFDDFNKKLSLPWHVFEANVVQRALVWLLKRKHSVIVGEWSLALDPQSLKGLNKEQIDLGLKQFGEAQINTFNTSDGWFFWTYKTEDMEGWSLRECVEKGLLPQKFS